MVHNLQATLKRFFSSVKSVRLERSEYEEYFLKPFRANNKEDTIRLVIMKIFSHEVIVMTIMIVLLKTKHLMTL